jgi:hypothetical protein
MVNSDRDVSKRYFVLHLPKDRAKRREGYPFQIQILDSRGRARLVGHVGYDEMELEIDGEFVPQAVLEAARRQPDGQGDYVDEMGQSIRPF